ncbi:hypothetical protein GGS26DRAFT_601482 [Hypomontagnella submonticulosa]|nr:hypothetical protein GGS26DRAFT_601482 [Hypomontagnella submonticulosa]
MPICEQLLDLERLPQIRPRVLDERDESQRKKDKLVKLVDNLDKEIQDRHDDLKRHTEKIDEITKSLKDDEGRIEREKLLESMAKMKQKMFGHALMLVTANQGNLDLIRNLSEDHKAALRMLDRRAEEDILIAKVEELQKSMKEKDESIQSLEKQLQDAQERNRQREGELSNATKTVEELQEQFRFVQLEESNASEATELGIAKFFATQSTWNGDNYELWVPLVRAAAEGTLAYAEANPIPGPWMVEETWLRGSDQYLSDESSSPPYSSFGIVDLARELYGRALTESYDGASLYILGVLQRRLGEDDPAPVPISVVLLVLETYLDVQSIVADTPGQIFFLALRQLASLVASRWPSPEAQKILDRAADHLDHSSLVDLDELLQDPTQEMMLRSQSPSEHCLFPPDLPICFVLLPQATDWIFAINFTNRSVRMIHNTRGKLDLSIDDVDGGFRATHTWRVLAPNNGQDITFDSEARPIFNWVHKYFKVEYLDWFDNPRPTGPL